jgi:hypothetical protein
MDRERFERMIEAYGADPARWPEGERAVGLRMAARADLAGRLAAERALDAKLDAWKAGKPSLELRARLTAAMPERPAAGRLRRWGWPGAALAAACAAGMVVGASVRASDIAPMTGDRDAEVVAASFDGVAVFGTPLDFGTIS